MNKPIFISKGFELSHHERVLVNQVYGALKQRWGHNIYLIGGIVRDIVLNIDRAKNTPLDFDFLVIGDATKALPHLKKKFPKVKWLTQDQLLTVRGRIGKHTVDIATARVEKYEKPGAFPLLVKQANVIDDAKRRDFTINSLRLPLPVPMKGALSALVEGNYQAFNDLQNRTLRFFHPKSCEDDPLRLIRAARYSARLGFSILDEQKEYLNAARTSMPNISAHRIRNELIMMLQEPDLVWQKAAKLLIHWQFFNMIAEPLNFRSPYSMVLLDKPFTKINKGFLRYSREIDLWQQRLLNLLGQTIEVHNKPDKVLKFLKWLGGESNIFDDTQEILKSPPPNWTLYLEPKNWTRLLIMFLLSGNTPLHHEIGLFFEKGYEAKPKLKITELEKLGCEDKQFKRIHALLWGHKWQLVQSGLTGFTKVQELQFVKSQLI